MKQVHRLETEDHRSSDSSGRDEITRKNSVEPDTLTDNSRPIRTKNPLGVMSLQNYRVPHIPFARYYTIHQHRYILLVFTICLKMSSRISNHLSSGKQLALCRYYFNIYIE